MSELARFCVVTTALHVCTLYNVRIIAASPISCDETAATAFCCSDMVSLFYLLSSVGGGLHSLSAFRAFLTEMLLSMRIISEGIYERRAHQQSRQKHWTCLHPSPDTLWCLPRSLNTPPLHSSTSSADCVFCSQSLSASTRASNAECSQWHRLRSTWAMPLLPRGTSRSLSDEFVEISQPFRETQLPLAFHMDFCYAKRRDESAVFWLSLPKKERRNALWLRQS